MPLPANVAAPPLVVTVLGSGTSTGVPMIGCDCDVCTSSDPRDKRMRASIVVGVGETAPRRNILVDTTPEMRIQVLRAGVKRIEAVLVTHNHADHIFGMDDIRQFNFLNNAPMPIYSDVFTLDHLKMVFGYAFRETQKAGGKPQLDLTPIEPYHTFMAEGVAVTPLTVMHGKMPILAYKFGPKFAYVTDVSLIPDETRPHLYGLDTLIMGGIRYEEHPTHFSIPQALEQIREFAPRQAYLTHMTHHVSHQEVSRKLPANVALAYDGLTFAIPAANGIVG